MREAILDAAEQLFTSKGYSKTKVEDIQDLGPRGAGSIYHQFASKRGLFEAVMNRVSDQIWCEVDADDLPRTYLLAVWRRRGFARFLQMGDVPPGFNTHRLAMNRIGAELGSWGAGDRMVAAVLSEAAVMACEFDDPMDIDHLSSQTEKVMAVIRAMDPVVDTKV